MSNPTLKILPALMAASLLGTSSVCATPITSDIVFINGLPVVTLQDAPGQSQFAPNFHVFPAGVLVPGVVLFYEDAAMTILSDQIWSDGRNLSFASDPDLQDLGTLRVLGWLVETGAPQDVSLFFTLGPRFLTVQSDVNVPDTGTTFSLFGLSLMGLVFLRRKLC